MRQVNTRRSTDSGSSTSAAQQQPQQQPSTPDISKVHQSASPTIATLRRRKPVSSKQRNSSDDQKQEPDQSTGNKFPRWIIWLALFSLTYLFWLQSFGTLYGIVIVLVVRFIQSLTRREWRIVAKPMPVVAIAGLVVFFLLAMVFHSAFRLALFDSYTDVQLSRLGHISDNSAKIWIRYANSSSLPYPELNVALFYRKTESPTDGPALEWQPGPSVQLTNDFDWVGVVELAGLSAETEYEYTWILKAGNSMRPLQFSRQGRAGGLSAHPKQQQVTIENFRFKTAPLPGRPRDFNFAFGSCIKPNYPYGKGLPGFAAIARQKPSFLLMLGDFIYIDIVVNFGSALSNYLRHYREVLGQEESVQLFSATPMYGINDDHEILNNWDRGDSGPFGNAMNAFKRYVANSNPKSEQGRLYFDFEYGDSSFFVADTRSYRNPYGTDRSLNGTAGDDENHSYFDTLAFNHPNRTMLGAPQLHQLFQWLRRVNQTHTFKFFVTSVPFTFNFPNDDTWYAYQHERQLILDFIDTNRIPNVIILSGDRHQVAVTDFIYADNGYDGSSSSSSNSGKALRSLTTEFSVSPINQFWVPIPFYFVSRNAADSTAAKMRRFPESDWIEDRRIYYSYNVGPVNVGKIIVETEKAYSQAARNNSRPSVTFCLYRPRSSWWWRLLIETWSSILFNDLVDPETAEKCAAGSDPTANDSDQLVYHYTVYGTAVRGAEGSGAVDDSATTAIVNCNWPLLDRLWNWARSFIDK